MLKKIIAVICLMAIFTMVLSSCGFYVKNEQRDLDQAIVEVRYGGRVAYVTKGELTDIYNQYGYYYIYYRGWTADETFEQLTKSLANSAMTGLKAKEYLSALEGVNVTSSTVGIEKPTTEQLINEMKQMLTNKQIMTAVQATNDTFQESYDELVTEVEKEIAAANGETDEEDTTTDEDVIKPRPQPEEEEDEDAPVVIPEDFFTIKNNELTVTDTVELEAIRRLKKSLEDQYKDYNYFFNNQLLSAVIERYEEEYTKNYEPTEAEIEARYNEMLALNIEKFAVEDAYATELAADQKTIIYHPGYDVDTETGYFYVKNILLKFSEEQAADLKAFTDANIANEEAIKVYRDYLSTQILVNVSNIEYDADIEESETNQMYIRTDVPVATIIDEIEEDLNAAANMEELLKVYVDWTYLVNDDDGVFTALSEKKPDYVVTPEGTASSYVPEFTELARSLFEVGEGAYGLADNELSYCVTDYGIHFILVSYIPFDYAANKGSDKIQITTDEKNILTLNAVIDQASGQTLREYIVETIKEEKSTNIMTAVNNSLYESNASAITNYPKVYKGLLEEAKKLEESVE